MTEEGENKGKKNIKESQIIFINHYLSFHFFRIKIFYYKT
jgi:hypothetical protein